VRGRGPAEIWLLGWSFGTDLALKYGCDPSVVGAVLISPPLRSPSRPTCRLGRLRASR
jgi:pimeloyl-ACP methyl ester carboxylesterase